MTEHLEVDLKQEVRVACTDCKSPNLQEVKKLDGSRIIRFIGVTDAVSNKHRFPHNVMEQMVNDAKNRYILPFMPASVKDIDRDTLDVMVDTKEFGFSGEPIAMRDMHITDQQKTKVGQVLRVDVKHLPDLKNGGEGRKYMEVVAEVFDPHMIRLIDRNMASKFSIGFKHKFDMVDGIKVSTYGVLDHFGFVDTPADPESVLLEKKEEDKMPGANDCVQAKVAEGMSQEEAERACSESAGKAEAFASGGDPQAGESRAYVDCVQGLVATGLDKDEAERACHDKAGNHADSDVEPATQPDKPSGEPSMKELELKIERKFAEHDRQVKSLTTLTKSLSDENKSLKQENKERAVKAEIKLLMDEGKVTPATKQDVFAFASALPDEKTRSIYYGTLQRAVDYDAKGSGESFDEKTLDLEIKNMYGMDSVDDVVRSITGRSD